MKRIKSDYLFKKWKELNDSEIDALCKYVDWHYLSSNILCFEFIDRFNKHLIWETVSCRKLEERTIEKYHKVLNTTTVFFINRLEESFLMRNIHDFIPYIDTIVSTQKHLSEKTLNKILMIQEMYR